MSNKKAECRKQQPKILAGLIGAALLFSCFFSTVSAQSKFLPMKDSRQFSLTLSEVTQKTGTITSNFIQEKNLDVISEKIITKGKFYFKKEDKLRWEYTEPFSYLIIMNGEKVLIKDEKKENHFDASSNKIFMEINSIMLGSIRGTILNEDKKFKIDFQENNQYNLVKMSPLSQQLKTYITEIRIYFNKISYYVSKLEIEESSGDYTKIEFSGMKINTPITDENFSVR
jgi:outer membrane lipoprotein-sorting protein